MGTVQSLPANDRRVGGQYWHIMVSRDDAKAQRDSALPPLLRVFASSCDKNWRCRGGSREMVQ